MDSLNNDNSYFHSLLNNEGCPILWFLVIIFAVRENFEFFILQFEGDSVPYIVITEIWIF